VSTRFFLPISIFKSLLNTICYPSPILEDHRKPITYRCNLFVLVIIFSSFLGTNTAFINELEFDHKGLGRHLPQQLVDKPRAILRNFKSQFDCMTHITCSITNISIYKYRANLVDLKILQIISKWDLVLVISPRRT
jgi:hypothetical protein